MKKLEDSKKKGKGIEEFKDKNVSILGSFHLKAKKKTPYSTTGEHQLQSSSLPALTRLRRAKPNPALKLGRPKHSSRTEPKLLNTPLQL
ncbi:hypothetical protein AAC387_Pa06g1147 [Persea americana]